ncbi:MAG: caspase family protein [Rhizobiales bacterium]|nr:caspase family protein [Hyphomicrobiales bacterium]
MNIRFALLAALILAIAPAAPSLAAENSGSRVALVIGNAKYPDSEAPLKEPLNDVRDVADELKHDGFDVETGQNLTGEAMRLALSRLYSRIKPGSVALIFFSGYGIQSGRQSYLIPVDAQIWTEADVRRDGFSLETILGEINNRGAGIKIALLDASRRNPFERRFRSFSAGLAPVIAPSGTLVMYSAALSSVVSDAGTDHSLFVSELLKEIRVPDLTAEETLNRTRVGVTRASRSEQVPWISSSLADDFYFIPGSHAKPGAVAPPPLPPRPVATPAAQPPAVTPPAVANKPATGPVVASKPPATEAPPGHATPPPPVASPPAAASPPAVTPQPAKPPAAPPQAHGDAKTALALADDPTIKSLTAKINTNPNDSNALYRRGQVYASKGAYSLAIKDFDATIRLNPKDVEAYNNRCWTRTVIGDLQPALRDCNEALRLRPNFVDALDSRGLLNLKSGANKNAIADFDAALKINPRLTSSLYGRGLARQRNGAVEQGNLDIANAKAMDPDIVKEFAGYGVH